MSSGTLDGALRETLAVFEEPGEPWTTPEVAECLEVGRRTTYARLEQLVERDHLETKKVGANARVWWQPPVRHDSSNAPRGSPATGSPVPGRAGTTDPLGEGVLDDVDVGIFVLDGSFDVAWVNGAVERYFGLDRGRILGRDKRQLIDEYVAEVVEDGETFAETVLETYDDNTYVERFECRVTPGDGREERWLEHRSKPVDSGEFAGGRIECYYDITERRNTTEQLREQRDFTRRVLETAPVGVLTVEEDGTFVTANRRATELLELEPRTDGTYTVDVNAVYDEDGTYLPPEERPYVRVFETGEPLRNRHLQLALSDGGRRWLSANFEPLLEDGEITRVLATIEDVSQLKAQADRLERKRDELESELEEILARITDAFYALDENWRFTHVNARAEELLDFEGEGLVGRHVWESFEWAADSTVREEYERAMETQEPTSFELYYPDPLDTWFEIHAYPSESGLSVYFRDVSERKARERELEQYELLTKRSSDVSVILGADGTYQYVTPSMANEFGHDPDALVGENAFEYVHPEDRERVVEEFGELVESRENEPSVEYRFRRADGSWAVVESRGRNLLDEPPIEGVVVYSWDVTDRKERERELREAKTQLEAATEAGRIGAWQWYVPDDRMVTDPWFAETFDIDPEATQEGVPVDSFVSSIHEEDRSRVEAAVEEAIASCGEYEEEYRVRDADDGLRWVVARGRVECDGEGNALAFPGALTDITERKRAELELERQRAQLATLNSLNEIVSEITDAVIEKSTREEIEQVVCDGLAAADAYEFAWLAEIDSSTETFEPRVTAGTRGYAEEVTIPLDPEDPRSEGPAPTAIREGETQVVQDVFADPLFEPVWDAADEYGFTAVAAIPVGHEGTVYGMLAVYADRENAFRPDEREVLDQLGEVVGHAIAAIERKRALMSDEVVELEFQIRNVFRVFEAPVTTDGKITINHAIPLGDDEFLAYGTAAPEAVGGLTALVDALPHCEDLEVRSRDDPVQFEVRMSDPPLVSTATDLGGYVEQFVIENGDCQLLLHLAPGVDVRRAIDVVEETYPQAELLRRRQLTRNGQNQQIQEQLVGDLTERQRAVLDAALHAGYFEWPRKTDGAELADSLGIAPSTFSHHLRKAQRKVFESLYS